MILNPCLQHTNSIATTDTGLFFYWLWSFRLDCGSGCRAAKGVLQGTQMGFFEFCKPVSLCLVMIFHRNPTLSQVPRHGGDEWLYAL